MGFVFFLLEYIGSFGKRRSYEGEKHMRSRVVDVKTGTVSKKEEAIHHGKKRMSYITFSVKPRKNVSKNIKNKDLHHHGENPCCIKKY